MSRYLAGVEELLKGAPLPLVADGVHESAGQAEDYLNDEDVESEDLHQRLKLATLRTSFERIHHDLGIVAGISDEPVDVAHVSHKATSEQEIVEINGSHFSVGVGDFTHELVEVWVGGLVLEDDARLLTAQVRLAFEELLELEMHVFLLQVGFAVQGLGLNITKAFGFTGAQNEHISRDNFILMNPDDLAHEQVLLLHGLERGTVIALDRTKVLFCVRFSALIILIEIFGSANENDETKRQVDGWKALADRDLWNQLKNANSLDEGRTIRQSRCWQVLKIALKVTLERS